MNRPWMFILTSVAMLCTALVAPAAVTPAAAAAGPRPLFQLPFTCGEAWEGNNTNSNVHHPRREIDFNQGTNDKGKPVLAAARGTVGISAHQGSDNGYGNLVMIEHGDGWRTYYAHLDTRLVREGQTVNQGDQIGTLGETTSPDRDISPHLHFEVRVTDTGYPENLREASFNGVVFGYPQQTLTSQNCPTHVVAQGVRGGIYHTIRTSEGWTRAGNVESPVGEIDAPITDVGSVQVDGELHVLAVANGGIYHAIRRLGLKWTGWGNVERATKTELGTVTDVSAAEVNGELHVVAVAGRTPFHAIRHADGSWTKFGNIKGQSELAGDPVETAVAGEGPHLHVLAVVAGGGLFHTIRGPGGWQSRWGNVESENAANDIGTVTDVAASRVGGSLHVVASNSVGGIFHSVRTGSEWTDFGNVEGQAGNLGDVRYVAAAGRGNLDLHVLAVIPPGTPYHTIRRAGRGWQTWGNVDGQVNFPDAIEEIDAG